MKADSCAPRLNERFVEYAQARGFVIDPARRRRPDDKPRVERMVSYVRDSFFAGESFASLDEMRRRAATWCLEMAGKRIHGTTRKRPLEVFEAEEKSRLLPAPEAPYDLPEWHDVTVVRDHHVAVKQALYSVPTAYIGERVRVRVDRTMVKIYHRGQVIKVHARVEAGKRSTDATDYPPHLRIYAERDVASLRRLAGEAGETIGHYAERLLDSALPWTRMRQVYRLLGHVKRYGASRVEAACQQALALDVIDVSRIGRMLERALESTAAIEKTPVTTPVSELRFARPASDFAVSKPAMKEGVLDA